jgi:hypothetical protein
MKHERKNLLTPKEKGKPYSYENINVKKWPLSSRSHYPCNSRTCEAETGGAQVQDQTGLHSKTLFKSINKLIVPFSYGCATQ